jgi:outer membrane protein assembly factor BamD (BamD/ComL family)
MISDYFSSSEYLETLIAVHLEQGNTEEAIELFAKLARDYPTSEFLGYFLMSIQSGDMQDGGSL